MRGTRKGSMFVSFARRSEMSDLSDCSTTSQLPDFIPNRLQLPVLQSHLPDFGAASFKRLFEPPLCFPEAVQFCGIAGQIVWNHRNFRKLFRCRKQLIQGFRSALESVQDERALDSAGGSP